MKLDSRTIERSDLEGKVLAELQEIAEALGLEGRQRLRKSDLIDAIVKAATDGTGASASDAPAAATGSARPSRNGPGRGPRTDRGTDGAGATVVDEPLGQDSALA